MLEELLERALEADPRLHLLHLGMNAGDIVEADAVDLVGGKVRGRIDPDEIFVKPIAAGHLAEADTVPRLGKIFVGDEASEALQGRPDPGFDRLGIGAPQRRLIGGGNIRRERLQRPIEAAAFHASGEHRVELLDDVAHDELRLDDARCHTLAHADDRTIDDRRERGHAAEAVLIILHRLERGSALARAQLGEAGMDAVEMVERPDGGERQHVRLEGTQVRLPLPFEDVVGDAFCGRERGRVDPPQRRQLLLGGFALGPIVRIGKELGHAAGIAEVAAPERFERVALQRRLIALDEQRRKRLRGRLQGGLRGSGSGRRCHVGAGAEASRCGHDQENLLHCRSFQVPPPVFRERGTT